MTFFVKRPTDDNETSGTSLTCSHNIKGVPDVRDATDMNRLTPEDGMKLYYRIKEAVELHDKSAVLELIDLDLIMETQEAQFDEEMVREYLRQTALKKLSTDEILALGVGNLAIYEKLKNHNA